MYNIRYFHGFKSKSGDEVHRWLQKYLPGVNVECKTMTSDPKIDIPKFELLDLSKYDLVTGLSMGGLYAYNVEGIPSVLINPGFGAHLKPALKDIKPLEDYVRTDLDNIYCFQALNDKHFDIMSNGYKARCGVKHFYTFEGVHVPTEENIKNIIAPFIMRLLKGKLSGDYRI